MKRILSVILSLALLASLLIIPMSVSAGEGEPPAPTVSIKTEGFEYSNDSNLAKGLVPYIFVTNDDSRTKNDSSTASFSDGKVEAGSEPSPGFKFSNDVNTFINEYDPSADFVFTKSASDYDAFVDVIYDLGCVADINKIQHFGHDTAGLTLGAYSVYASTDVNNLFDRDKSLVVDYQNKDVVNSQQFEFLERPARFVAFRIYCPVTTSYWAYASNQLRIKELAIYGTQTGAYKVTEIPIPTDSNPVSIDPNSLLKSDTLMSIKGYENDDEIGNITIDKNNAHQQKLHSGTYQKDGHGDFITTAVFYDSTNKKFKNGFIINREDTTGNIEFRTQGAETTIHSDFTYDLGSYYKIDRFELYSSTDLWNKLLTQSYEVYIGNDLATLYEGTPVAVYNNYYNNFAQSIKFKESQIGKYLGVRILMAADRVGNANYVRLDELAAYGEDVGTPPVIQVEDGATCGSAVVTVTDVDANLASVKVNGEEKDLVDGRFVANITTGDYTVVATDDKGNVTTKEITVADHNYQYTAKDNVITETCANCDRPAETLTLKVVDGPLVYDRSDKYASIIADKTEGFADAVNEANIVFEKDGKPVDPAEVKNAGNYVAKVKIGDATAVLPFTIEKAIPEYTAPEYKVGEAGNELSTIKLDDGFIWKNPTEKIKYSNDDKFEYDAIYTPADVDNYKIAELKIKVNGVDTIPPTGTIKIKETVWDKLTNLFIKDKETVTITGSDAGSGVDKIYYYVADAAVDTATIEESAWKPYTDPFKIEKEGNNFVYAKIVDVAGNVTVISTDGIVLDTKAPSADVTNLGKYYGSLTVTVKDDNLDTVKLNGKDVTLDEEGKFVVDAADGAQKIVITDKAGNETTYTVTVVEVKGFNPAEGKLTVDMDEKNVDKEKIAEKIEKGETVTFFDISVDNATGSTANVLEIPVDFDFTGKLNVRVLHNHGGNVNELKALTARPTAGFENGTFFADKENGKLYIYSKEFSPFAVAFHVHDVKHVEAKAATAEADGNIEYWYCEGCDKYFSDAAATKEIQKADTVVKYVAPSNGNTGSGSNAPTTGGETENNATVPGGTSPVTGETAMTVVLFAILLGAIAVMGISIVKSRKAKSK